MTLNQPPMKIFCVRHWVWALRHHSGVAVEWTKAKVAVRNVVAPALQPDQQVASGYVTRNVIFLRNDSRCRRYVSVLPNVTRRYLRSKQMGRVSLFMLTLSWRVASLLLRWNTVDTICSVELQLPGPRSGGIHLRLPCPCSATISLSASLHQHVWLLDLQRMHTFLRRWFLWCRSVFFNLGEISSQGEYIFSMARFAFVACIKQFFLGRTLFGGHKNIWWDTALEYPRVAAGLALDTSFCYTMLS